MVAQVHPSPSSGHQLSSIQLRELLASLQSSPGLVQQLSNVTGPGVDRHALRKVGSTTGGEGKGTGLLLIRSLDIYIFTCEILIDISICHTLF